MSTVTIDLSKLTQSEILALESAGAIPLQPSPAPIMPSPAPAPAPGVPTGAGGGGGAPGTPPVVTPPTLADRIAAAAQEVGQVLSTGVAGPEAGVIGQAAELAAGVGDVIWHMFNPHTGITTKHKTLSDAITSGAAHMQAQQPDVVANADPNTSFEITPVVHITGADVAKLPVQAGSGSTQT